MAQHFSMESMLDEERKEVLALLEGHAARQRASASSAPGRSSSPFPTPQSPIRSMLDITPNPAPRAGGPAAAPIRSMLDIGPPSTRVSHAPSASLSAQTSPIAAHHRLRNIDSSSGRHRSASDASAAHAEAALRDFPERPAKDDPTSTYQFAGFLPSNPGGPVAPKRNTLAGKKPVNPIPDALRGTELGASILGGYGSKDGRGRHNSMPGTGFTPHSKSKSPLGRMDMRSQSPHSNRLAPKKDDLTKFTLADGTVVDMNSAYRRLSDANLALSGGSLSALSAKSQRRRESGGATGNAAARLEKDYTQEDALIDSSDDDDIYSSDDDRHRGRKKKSQHEEGQDDHHPESKTLGMGRAKGPRQSLSLLAAAEEERQQIAARSTPVRSMLDPEITVTGPGGDRVRNSKTGVHPSTAFDQGPSGLNTPVDSEEEADISDIKRAQKLSINMTPITSTPDVQRCIRTIYRGDFAKMQREAEDDQRRVRKYLVATDLSDEATHALEWTVGTVLRDGDTLLAIYCVDEETGIAPTGDDNQQITDQAAAIAVSAAKPYAPTPTTNSSRPSPLGNGSPAVTPSPAGRERSKAEQERYRAVQDITDRVSRLLRKTKLQVRVVIEVIHCKSPKHLITEVIDFINPTLVILGSRGRSALKG